MNKKNNLQTAELVKRLAIEQSSDQELVEQIRDEYRNDIIEFARIACTEDSHDQKNPIKPLPLDKVSFIKKLLNAYVKFNKIIILKSRQQYVTWIFCIASLWHILFFKSVRVAFVSKKGNDSRRLIERVKVIYDSLPDWKPKAEFVLFPEPRVSVPDNHSFIFAYPSGADQLRGETFTAIFSDEAAFQEEQEKTYRASKPTIDSGGKFVIVSTPNGQSNLFYHLWKDPSFEKFEIHYKQNPFRDKNWEKEARKGVRDSDWQQEQECNFLTTQSNTIFSDYNYQTHVKKLQYDPKVPIMVGHDLGFNRPGIAWCQYSGGIFKILRSFLGYKTIINNFADQFFSMEKEHFPDAMHFFDFVDSAGKQPNKQTGFTDIQALNKLLEPKNRYLRFRTCISVEDDFNIVRGFLTRLQKGESCFQIDVSNTNIIEGFRGGMHYHGNSQKICGCTDSNEFFDSENDYYKHLNDCVRYIIVNNFSHDGPISSKQDKLDIPRTRDKRFTYSNYERGLV